MKIFHKTIAIFSFIILFLLSGCSNTNKCIEYLSKYDDTFEEINLANSSNNTTEIYTFNSQKYPGSTFNVRYEAALGEFVDNYTNLKFENDFVKKGTEISESLYPGENFSVAGTGEYSSHHDASTTFENIYNTELTIYGVVIFKEVSEEQFEEDINNCLSTLPSVAGDVPSITFIVKYYFTDKELPDDLKANFDGLSDYDAMYRVSYFKGSAPKVKEEKYNSK